MSGRRGRCLRLVFVGSVGAVCGRGGGFSGVGVEIGFVGFGGVERFGRVELVGIVYFGAEVGNRFRFF